MHARRVDEHELRVGQRLHAQDARPGRLRLVRDDGDLAADERVQQRGFAGVRPADKAMYPVFIVFAPGASAPGGRRMIPRRCRPTSRPAARGCGVSAILTYLRRFEHAVHVHLCPRAARVRRRRALSTANSSRTLEGLCGGSSGNSPYRCLPLCRPTRALASKPCDATACSIRRARPSSTISRRGELLSARRRSRSSP